MELTLGSEFEGGMAENQLLKRLHRGETVLGVAMMYPAPGIVEGMAPGWDFVWIDCQHGQFGYAEALAAIHAAGAAGVETILRVAGHEFGVIGPMADLAPAALMVPMVNTADQARQIVQAVRFPPLGQRSYGGRRVIDKFGRNYPREHQLVLIAQIETLEAVEQADAIAATEGVDMLFFGADDMRMQMNLPMDIPIEQNDRMLQAMRHTAQAARQAGKLAGCVASTSPQMRMASEMSYQLIVGGGDSGFLRSASQARLAELRAAKPAGGAAGVY